MSERAFMISNIFFVLIFAFMAIYNIYIGAKVFISKKPIIYSARWMFLMMLVAFSPTFILGLISKFSRHGAFSMESVVFPLFLLVMLGFMYFQMRGYMIVGMKEESFREALRYSLESNELEYEESLGKIILPSINTSLQVSIQEWTGVSQLKMQKSADNSLLKKIIDGIDDYYLNNNKSTNIITPIFYLLTAVFIILIGLSMMLRIMN